MGLQDHLPPIEENPQQLRAAAWKGFVCFGLAAVVLMLLFAISGFGLLACDWWRMNDLYHLNRSFFEQILARDPHLEMLMSFFLAAVVHCVVAALMGIRFGKRQVLFQKGSKFTGATSMALPALAASLTVFAVTLAGLHIIMREDAWIRAIASVGFMFLIFWLPSIPSGIGAAWFTRLWISRESQREQHSTASISQMQNA
jgi:hypothetical protein